MSQDALHIPVLLQECLDLLDPCLAGHPAPIVIDATVGLGGHSDALLQRYPRLHVIGLDRDTDALAHSSTRLAQFGDRVHLVHTVYDQMESVLAQLSDTLPAQCTRDRHGTVQVQGVLMDLGISSLQVDTDARGFSYSRPTALDMRMDARSDAPTAQHIVATYSEKELTRILSTYGQERFARRVAAALVRAREQEPLTDSAQLAAIVREAIPAAARRTGGNPAKRTFQALRIEVNDEMGALERALPQAIDVLAVGGRLVVLTYHSLEDRIVKHALVKGATAPTPVGVPLTRDQDVPVLQMVARGQRPQPQEIDSNSRAQSARVRAGHKLREAA